MLGLFERYVISRSMVSLSARICSVTHDSVYATDQSVLVSLNNNHQLLCAGAELVIETFVEHADVS
jgi:hypothetical protein